ncbi:hypothetical protein, partial [Candidatus Oleimmundimicrobium sp.]|uniref:hypothetical protein n=1 Tax=Candidatus Oleimmundimicrobium sp. TaxID=3060597 RepID=UPI00271A0A36
MKMTFRKRCLAIVAGTLLTATPVLAAEKAASVDELLRLINSARVSESAEHKQREAEFLRDKQNQQNLLSQAKATMNAEENRSIRMEQTFAENDLKVEALQIQLNERLGSLKELFGHLTSTAGDMRAIINQSIVTAQYPERGQFLDELISKMSSDTRLPRLDEIERLWAEMSREMVESGKVVKFPATVVTAHGEQAQQEVVRVGVFNLLSNGSYLDYSAKTGIISELPRQPSGTSAAAKLQGATEGFTSVGI